ncbi:Alpha/Beta hydrolase protein [Apiosordaria backusii]|uniref:Kynurenine formamidase n=1 Tax=Apiosordaria backusii TaxID=314023 RepID=A0AA40EY38_9PEZI|nr:Alpha/Beta hydrolase protein [Apiosordaria backusii]
MWRRLHQIVVKVRRRYGFDCSGSASSGLATAVVVQPKPDKTIPVITMSSPSEKDERAWASVPWKSVIDEETGKVLGWSKSQVPYVPGTTDNSGLSLQTLDVWLPASATVAPDGTVQEPPDAVSLPSQSGHWVVYIHGGAWRDPLIDASSFSPTAINLLQAAASSYAKGSVPIAGVASLNYRLSPHPNHPVDGRDPNREAKHPDHISDILTGLAFLQRLGGATGSWLLSGHSCGATLAFQAVMAPSRWGLDTTIVKPTVVVGLNGLYDLAGFITMPPPDYAGLGDAYEEFTRGAFGDDEKVWQDACPATADDWTSEWQEGKQVVLAQSRDDSLVPYGQLEKMGAYLSKSSSLHIREMEAGGDHDDIWKKGDRLAEILYDVVSGLM